MSDLTCPICGLPMVHSRTRGYHCFYQSHEELQHEVDIRAVVRAMARRAQHNRPARVVRPNR